MKKELIRKSKREDVLGRNFYTHSSQATTMENEEVLAILGDYALYQSNWAANYPLNCARIIKSGESYFVTLFGSEPDGLDYEDDRIGPFSTSAEAVQSALQELDKPDFLSNYDISA